jgi:hypothetical protein
MKKKILSRKNEYKISEVFSIYISIVYKLIEKNKETQLNKNKMFIDMNSFHLFIYKCVIYIYLYRNGEYRLK